MKQVISLYLPRLSTDLVRRQMGSNAPSPDNPLALVGREGQKQVIMATDRQAARQGVAAGMAVTQARVLVKDLYLQDYNVAANAQTMETIALWALRRYSPTIATDKDGLWIDATGCVHLFGNAEQMLADLVSKLNAQGFEAKAALAPTYGAAHAFTRTMKASMLVATESDYLQRIYRLPIAALRLQPSASAGLNKLGIETVQELKEKPRKSIVMRFGKDVALRLDQAMGCAAEVIQPVVPQELITVQRVFAEPIAAPETITRYIGILTESMCRLLEEKCCGARCLDLYCHRIDNETRVLRINLAQPRRDAKRLTRLLCDKLETLDPGYGIEIIRLAAPWTEPLHLQQTDIDGTKAKADLTSLIDTLANRIGAEHIYQLAPLESDVPERSIQRIAPISAKVLSATSYPRPARLFERPEPIETIAMLPDYPPVSFTWRGIRHKVSAADGPERIYGEWWRRDAEMEAVRDYFQLEDETGARFWVFRSGDGVVPDSGSLRWFLHGLFG